MENYKTLNFNVKLDFLAEARQEEAKFGGASVYRRASYQADRGPRDSTTPAGASPCKPSPPALWPASRTAPGKGNDRASIARPFVMSRPAPPSHQLSREPIR
jgi:hypothetical protein